MRNKRELNAKLKGATLGDAEADVDDTMKWIKRAKKKEKELAKKRQAELENMDRMAEEEYTESAANLLRLCKCKQRLMCVFCLTEDLEGLKVTHDFEAMEDGEERILTLKDSRILENEGASSTYFRAVVAADPVSSTEDELQNVEMADHERADKNNELKIKRRDYTGYDDDEFTPGQAGMKRSLLSKYDDFLEGPKEIVSFMDCVTLSCS